MPVTKREEVTKQGFCKILGRTLRLRGSLLLVLRDCSLFMPKGRGSVIFKQFRHMKNLPLLGSGYFKKLPPPPPVYVTGPTCNPHPLRTRRASDCEIAYNTCSGRLPINQNPLQGHLWSYSVEVLNKESEFAAPVLCPIWRWQGGPISSFAVWGFLYTHWQYCITTTTGPGKWHVGGFCYY